MPQNQNLHLNHNITTCNKSLENVSKFKYLGTTVTNRNKVQDEIKEYILKAFDLLCMGVKHSLTLMDEHKLLVFENVFWKIYEH
jgi:hypothetical protein